MGRPVAVGSRLSEGGDGGVDDLRCAGAHGLVTDPEAIDHAGTERLEDHVGGLGEAQEGLAPGLALEIDREAPLAPVRIAEIDRVAVLGGPDHARGIAALRILDLDHVRAVIGHHHRQMRTRQEPGEIQHSDPFELHGSPPHFRSLSVGADIPRACRPRHSAGAQSQALARKWGHVIGRARNVPVWSAPIAHRVAWGTSCKDSRNRSPSISSGGWPASLLLGIISGFPWVLIGSSLTLWLTEDGLSRSTIGWAGLIFGVYAFNFLWAPLIDRVRLPWLSQRLGQRRAWILILQAAVLVCLVLWSALDPSESLGSVIAVGLAIAVASATQDIAIDALRIEQIGKTEDEAMAAGAAVAVVGWWSGFKLGGIVALETAEGFQNAGIENYWQATFLVLGIVVVLCNVGLRFVREAAATERIAAQAEDEERIASRLRMSGPLGRATAWLGGTVVAPLMRFFVKNGVAIAAAVLGFVFLFKIGEAFMGRMSLVFYTEIGFTKSDIALYSKGLGWIVTVAFTVLGGLVAIRIGLVRAMFVSGIAMALTNLMFALLAWSGKSEVLFAAAVVMDDLTSAFATVTFVAFISMLVDRTYTATQYALLASLGTAGRTLLAASSGELVDWLEGDWGFFFVITALMVLPSLVCLWAIRAKLRDLLAGARVRLMGKDAEDAPG